MIVRVAATEHDTGVLMVKNTEWARQFFRDARAVLQRPALMAGAIGRDTHLHGARNVTLEQVIMSLLVREDGKHLSKVTRPRSSVPPCRCPRHLFWRGYGFAAAWDLRLVLMLMELRCVVLISGALTSGIDREHEPGSLLQGAGSDAVAAAAPPQVHFERTFCLACFWRDHNLRAPTSFITHFSAVPSCGAFGLQSVGAGALACSNHVNLEAVVPTP